MLKKLFLLACSAVMAATIVMPGLVGNICEDVPEFTREKLTYLVSHNLIDDADLDLLTQAKTHQLSPAKTRALCLSLNELYDSTRRHRAVAPSFFTVPRLAAFTVLSLVGTFFYLMVTGESKSQAPAPRVSGSGNSSGNAASAPSRPLMSPEAAMEDLRQQLEAYDHRNDPPPMPVFEPLTIEPPLRSPENQAYDRARMEERERNRVPIVYDTSPGTEAAELIQYVADGFPYSGPAKDMTREELDARYERMLKRDAEDGGRASFWHYSRRQR